MFRALIALSLPAHFQFGGGSDNDLVAAVSTITQKPAVMLASMDNKWRKCEFEFDSIDQFRSRLRSNLSVKSTKNGSLAEIAWPLGVGYTIYFERYRTRLRRGKPSDDLRDRSLSLRTEGNDALSLYDLGSLGLSKPVTWERFFERVRFRVSCTNASEEAFLTVLAEAMGAKLISEKKTYHLIIDAAEYRSRAIRMWQLLLANPENEFEQINAAYMIELLPRSNDSLISKAFHDPDYAGGWATIWKPGSVIHKLAWQRPAPFHKMLNKQPDETFLRVADPAAPVYGYILDTGSPKVGYRSLDGKEVYIL